MLKSCHLFDMTACWFGPQQLSTAHPGLNLMVNFRHFELTSSTKFRKPVSVRRNYHSADIHVFSRSSALSGFFGRLFRTRPHHPYPVLPWPLRPLALSVDCVTTYKNRSTCHSNRFLPSFFLLLSFYLAQELSLPIDLLCLNLIPSDSRQARQHACNQGCCLNKKIPRQSGSERGEKCPALLTRNLFMLRNLPFPGKSWQ